MNAQFVTTNARIDGVEIKMEFNHHDLIDTFTDKTEQVKDVTRDHEYRLTRVEHKVGLAV